MKPEPGRMVDACGWDANQRIVGIDGNNRINAF